MTKKPINADVSARFENIVFDLMIIGGGINGCAAALEATRRGLKVALVEKRDFGAMASSHSSKLIHGGVRYLETMDFSLVHEALSEQSVLLNKECPHLVRKERFIFPAPNNWLRRTYFRTGLALYDLLGRRKKADRAKSHNAHNIQTNAPALAAHARHALSYMDAMVDDARLCWTVAQSAMAQGAQLANYTSYSSSSFDDGVHNIQLRDHRTGKNFSARAYNILVCCGAETGLALPNVDLPLLPSKGVHITLPKSAIDAQCALVIKTPTSVLFALPWDNIWIIGTTDTPVSDPAHPVVDKKDIAYLLGQLNAHISPAISEDMILASYVGVRPLVAQAGRVSKISRKHRLYDLGPHMKALLGGKLTTYRKMAEDSINALFPETPSKGPSPLLGTGPRDALNKSPHAKHYSAQQIDHLWTRYGLLAADVMAMAAAENISAIALAAPSPYLLEEAVYALTHEQVFNLDDIFSRRLRLSLYGPKAWDRAKEKLNAYCTERGLAPFV